MTRANHLLIIGAGFSWHAGSPLTTEFTEALLDVRPKPTGASALLVAVLRRFIHDAFDHSPSAKARFWPQLEDVFTCIDLAANSGHHLGGNYPPSSLRTIRLALIVRIIRMLRQRSQVAEAVKGRPWKQVQKFFREVDINHTAFLSMNWDAVVEDGVARCQGIVDVDYGCDARRAEFRTSVIHQSGPRGHSRLQMLKLHGSVNWLYCDNCRGLWWFDPKDTGKIASQLFRSSDWRFVRNLTGQRYSGRVIQYDCPSYHTPALGTRLATFSYRKALDFPMYQKSWLAAESRLHEAQTWIFIGYSLPATGGSLNRLMATQTRD